MSCYERQTRGEARAMRTVLSVVILLGTLWAIDAFAYGGQYGTALWYQAKHQGEVFQYEIAYWLRRLDR